jgi:hypothetical protein
VILREKVARAIAQSKTGLDPDCRVAPFQPLHVGDGAYVVPPADSLRPLWTQFTGAADAALAAIREEFETAGIIDAEREVI